MSGHKYSSLKKYYDEIALQAVEECMLCGECVRNCPMISLTPLKGKPPEDIMEKMINFLKDGVYSEDVYLRAFTCAGCGHCSDLCPRGIDPMLTNDAVKIELAKQGFKSPAGDKLILPERDVKPGDIPIAIQIKPAEMRWFKTAPPQPAPVENLVFLGCFPPSSIPDRTFAFLDILEHLGVNFAALAGGELCCGVTSCPGEGKAQDAEDKARDLVANIKAFSPHLRKYPGLVLKDIVTLVNEAMGGTEYKDKLAKYWKYESIDKIIEESRDIFLEHGFTEEEMSRLLPAFFPFADLEDEYKGGFI